MDLPAAHPSLPVFSLYLIKNAGYAQHRRRELVTQEVSDRRLSFNGRSTVINVLTHSSSSFSRRRRHRRGGGSTVEQHRQLEHSGVARAIPCLRDHVRRPAHLSPSVSDCWLQLFKMLNARLRGRQFVRRERLSQ